jgi:hypothetical protein
MRFRSAVTGEKVEFYCDVADMAKVARLKAELAEYKRLEPGADWRLESRGTHVTWQTFRD